MYFAMLKSSGIQAAVPVALPEKKKPLIYAAFGALISADRRYRQSA